MFSSRSSCTPSTPNVELANVEGKPPSLSTLMSIPKTVRVPCQVISEPALNAKFSSPFTPMAKRSPRTEFASLTTTSSIQRVSLSIRTLALPWISVRIEARSAVKSPSPDHIIARLKLSALKLPAPSGTAVPLKVQVVCPLPGVPEISATRAACAVEAAKSAAAVRERILVICDFPEKRSDGPPTLAEARVGARPIGGEGKGGPGAFLGIRHRALWSKITLRTC